MNIDPGVITIVQTTFLEQIQSAFTIATSYAFNLLYLFAALELVLLGIAWMFRQDIGWNDFFFKLIKIGLIFFIIQNYPWLLNTILDSFAQLAGIVINDSAIAEYVFNPAKIWEYGYDVGVNLLYLASNSEMLGLVMILLTMGMGILLVFGLLGIQMVLQIVGFYVVSFGALILLPFGVFSPSRKMLDRAVQAVLQAGIRLMVLIIIIGIAVLIWNGFELSELITENNFNINQPLGLFFTALLFLSLAYYLPRIVGQTVGELSDSFIEDKGATTAFIGASSSSLPISAAATSADVQLAATLPATSGSEGGYTARSGEPSNMASATTVSPTTSTFSGASLNPASEKETLSQASTTVAKSFSAATVKKIKEAVRQAMQDKKE